MESRKIQAAEKKQSGMYNCTQSVLCTYSDITGLDEDTAKHLTQAFGAGMGNMEGTCGSLIGAGIVLSIVAKDKAQAMQCMRRIMDSNNAMEQLFANISKVLTHNARGDNVLTV